MALVGATALAGSADQLALSIVNANAARTDAHEGVWGKRVHVAAAAGAGIAFVGEKFTNSYSWDEIKSIKARRGSVIVKVSTGKERTRSFRLVVDDVQEPALAPTFARVLEEMRAGTFAFNSSAWFEHQNLVDRMRADFTDQDDHMLPGVAVTLWIALGLVAAVIFELALNAGQARGVPAGSFSVGHRASLIDPRVLIAGFAASGMLTALILRFALGPQYNVWVRGVGRGWQETGSRAWRLVVRQLGRILLATQSSAIVMLLALLAFWPNVASTAIVGPTGIQHEILLPFISLDEKWSGVKDITITDSAELRDRTVKFTFKDGRELVAEPDDIGGGTPTQFYNVSTAWMKAALP